MPQESLTSNDDNTYDVLIIGGGIAGLTAAINLAVSKVKVAYIEKDTPGGKLLKVASVHNFPMAEGINGTDLAMSYYKQAEDAGANYIYGEVVGIAKKLGMYAVYTSDTLTRFAKVVIIASGIKDGKLNVIGEDEYLNKGVSTCVQCDISLVKDKVVGLVGTYQDALKLAEVAKEVALFTKDLTILNNNPKIKISHNAITAIEGDGNKMTNVDLEDGKKIYIEHLFIELSGKPATDFLPNWIKVDTTTHIILNEPSSKMTSAEGIFVIGDVSKQENRQVATAIDEAITAAAGAIAYLSSIK